MDPLVGSSCGLQSDSNACVSWMLAALIKPPQACSASFWTLGKEEIHDLAVPKMDMALAMPEDFASFFRGDAVRFIQATSACLETGISHTLFGFEQYICVCLK